MNRTLNFEKYLIIFGTPILIIGLVVFIAKSSLFSANLNSLSLGITFDLLLTAPLAYLVLIRKTKIPKTTIVPFIIFGSVICSKVLPIENQYYLNLFKSWLFPAIEISVLFYVVYSFKKGIKDYKQNKKLSIDFFTSIKNVCRAIFPKVVAIFFAFEIATFYYGFVNWTKINLKENEFSYHKKSTSISTLVAFIFLIGIETIVFHILLTRWNPLVAWIFTGLSFYTAIQLLGFLKSMMKRPISIINRDLNLYYGIMNETTIKIDQILEIKILPKEIEYNEKRRKFSFLDTPNILIKLKKENTLNGLYGIKKKFSEIGIYVDNPTEFQKTIQESKP